MTCTKNRCKRHEFDHGLCLPHLKQAIEEKRKAEKKKAAAAADAFHYEQALETRSEKGGD